MSEEEMRNSPVRHRWALVRFCYLLLGATDEAVASAAQELLDELRTEQYRGEFVHYDSLISRNLRHEDGR